MNVDKVSAGKGIPDDFNVIIEIPAQADPVKYEVDKDSGAMEVDRFMGTSMRYPANYGFIPNTLCDDGDPLDVLVVTPFPLIPGCLVRCRPLGVLNMTDEKGGDAKLVAAPLVKLCPMYADINDVKDLPELLRQQIAHFFEHYKDLEPGKWVKLEGWGDVAAARAEVEASVALFEKKGG